MKKNGLPNSKLNITPETMRSMIQDGVRFVPVYAENAQDEELGPMDQEEFMKFSHRMTDKELNEFLYRQVKETIEAGLNPAWPEDDFGILTWFQFSFITPEMREVFPDIAREYLAHEPLVGTEFADVPYPRMNEKTWEDAFYFRVLSMMVLAVRRGSVYSRNVLISLYKVYYKREYDRLKKLRKLTYLDLLQFHDEDCRRRGLPSGHAVNGERSYQDYVLEERSHEAGWTRIESKRTLAPVAEKVPRSQRPKMSELSEKEQEEMELWDASVDLIRGMMDAPDEPPLQPTSARVYIMCEMLRIPIDETCNHDACQINEAAESLLNVTFVGYDDYRKERAEFTERVKEFVGASYPETADPYLYQTDEKYVGLEMAECTLWEAFREYDRNVRMPYDSRKFDLLDLMAKATVTLNMFFPGKQVTYNEIQLLSMVHYLSECLCDLMITREKELNSLLHFEDRKHLGEWREGTNPEKAAQAEKLLKSVESLRGTEYVKPEKVYVPEKTVDPETLNAEEMKAEIERLKTALAEKETALAESEQKVLRQHFLYEQSRKQAEELSERTEEAETEHAELIALREYVYNLRMDEAPVELDEDTQEQMIRDLQDKNVAVVGGTERWVKRMKRLFPKWKFISVEDDSIGGYNALESASFIYMYTNALKHKVYYRAMNLIRRSEKMLFYLGSTNTAENIVRFHRDLCR